MPIFSVDVARDRSIPSFDRYYVRSASKARAKAAVITMLALSEDEKIKIEVESADPDMLAVTMGGIPDDTPILSSNGDGGSPDGS